MGLDESVALAGHGPDGGRRGVELVHAMALDQIPIPSGVGIKRNALENQCGRTVAQRPVDNVGVARDPAHVGDARVDIAIVVVEHIFVRERHLQQVSRSGMGHALGPARAARGVEEKERVLAVHVLNGTIGTLAIHGLAQPDVALGIEGNFVTRSPRHEHRAHRRAGHHRFVDRALEWNDFSAAHALVGGNDGRASSVVDPVAQALGRKAGKHHVVNGADACACQHGVDRFENHGQVDGNPIALTDAVVAKNIGQSTNFALKFAIGDALAFAGRIRLPNQCNLVAPLGNMPVHAIVAGIEPAVQEPSHLAVFKIAVADLAKRMEPRQGIKGALPPEGVGIRQAFRVQLEIGLERRNVRAPAEIGGWRKRCACRDG